MPEIHRLKNGFGIDRFVIVGDRGMISQKAIDEIKTQDGIDWITALKSSAIRASSKTRPCNRSCLTNVTCLSSAIPITPMNGS